MIALHLSMSRLASRCLLALSVRTGRVRHGGRTGGRAFGRFGALGPVCCGGPGEPPDLVFADDTQRQECERWSQPRQRGTLVQTQARRVGAYRVSEHRLLRSQTGGAGAILVLGLIQVESGFRKFAISSVGARGYMQIMPFWSRTIGNGDASSLFHMQTNIRFGCVILRHYLDREKGNLFMALGRYKR